MFCPFSTGVYDALPIEPWYVAGPVIKGYGRGSKVLGIPTGMFTSVAISINFVIVVMLFLCLVIRGILININLQNGFAANLPTSSFSAILSDYVCGIYLGWAGLSNRGVFKMVMSVGWNPYFDNSEKTVVSEVLVPTYCLGFDVGCCN